MGKRDRKWRSLNVWSRYCNFKVDVWSETGRQLWKQMSRGTRLTLVICLHWKQVLQSRKTSRTVTILYYGTRPRVEEMDWCLHMVLMRQSFSDRKFASSSTPLVTSYALAQNPGERCDRRCRSDHLEDRPQMKMTAQVGPAIAEHLTIHMLHVLGSTVEIMDVNEKAFRSVRILSMFLRFLRDPYPCLFF